MKKQSTGQTMDEVVKSAEILGDRKIENTAVRNRRIRERIQGFLDYLVSPPKED